MKVYLGDGVYAEFDEGRLVLTTEDGISVTNTIYLENEVYNALLAFVERLRKGKG
jgi:hypothetical protein